VKLRWVRSARRESVAVFDYYEAIEKRYAREFKEELAAAVEFIRERPERLPVRQNGFRRVNLRKYPYHLPYTVYQGAVWIMAVAHNKRRPEYWLSRSSQIE
jgi:toxin ParE1/3/4